MRWWKIARTSLFTSPEVKCGYGWDMDVYFHMHGYKINFFVCDSTNLHFIKSSFIWSKKEKNYQWKCVLTLSMNDHYTYHQMMFWNLVLIGNINDLSLKIWDVNKVSITAWYFHRNNKTVINTSIEHQSKVISPTTSPTINLEKVIANDFNNYRFVINSIRQ